MKNFKELCVNDDVLGSVWCRCGPRSPGAAGQQALWGDECWL